MARASVDDLQSVRGIGRDKAVTLVAAFTLASKMAEELQRESPVLDTPEAVAMLLREQNRLKAVETFQILLLNTRRRLIRVEEVSQGTLDTILVHPREVFKSAIAARAAALVLVHNLCAVTHTLCYVEFGLMWSTQAKAIIGSRAVAVTRGRHFT